MPGGSPAWSNKPGVSRILLTSSSKACPTCTARYTHQPLGGSWAGVSPHPGSGGCCSCLARVRSCRSTSLAGQPPQQLRCDAQLPDPSRRTPRLPAPPPPALLTATLVLALVSTNRQPLVRANACPCSEVTSRWLSCRNREGALGLPGCSVQRRRPIARLHARTATAQHSTAQHSTAQHSTAQHSTAQHSTAQHSTARPQRRRMTRRARTPQGTSFSRVVGI